MKTVDQRLQDAIDAQNLDSPNKIKGKVRIMSRREFSDEVNRKANIADYRVGLIAVIMLIGLVVYQIWEMTQ